MVNDIVTPCLLLVTFLISIYARIGLCENDERLKAKFRLWNHEIVNRWNFVNLRLGDA